MTKNIDFADLMFGYTTDQALNEGLLFDPRIRFANKNVFVSSEFIYELNKEEIIVALLKVFTVFLSDERISIVEIEVKGKPIWLMENQSEFIILLPDSYYNAVWKSKGG